jgi:hypothetical protein
MKRMVLTCLIGSLAALLGGCNGCSDYSVGLPNGYRLARNSAESTDIFKSSTRIEATVPPNIIELNVQGDLVFGQAVHSPMASRKSVAGYFILDTKHERAQVGLTKEKWLAELKKFGISEEPKLKKPSRRFSW